MLKDAEKSKDISEDDRKSGQKKIQDVTDGYIAKIDQISATKEAEIMDV